MFYWETRYKWKDTEHDWLFSTYHYQGTEVQAFVQVNNYGQVARTPSWTMLQASPLFILECLPAAASLGLLYCWRRCDRRRIIMRLLTAFPLLFFASSTKGAAWICTYTSLCSIGSVIMCVPTAIPAKRGKVHYLQQQTSRDQGNKSMDSETFSPTLHSEVQDMWILQSSSTVVWGSMSGYLTLRKSNAGSRWFCRYWDITGWKAEPHAC